MKLSTIIQTILLIAMTSLAIITFFLWKKLGIINDDFIKQYAYSMLPVGMIAIYAILEKIIPKSSVPEQIPAKKESFSLNEIFRGDKKGTPIPLTSRETFALTITMSLLALSFIFFISLQKFHFQEPELLAGGVGIVMIILLLFVPSLVRKKQLTEKDVDIAQQISAREDAKKSHLQRMRPHYWFLRLSRQQQGLYIVTFLAFGFMAQSCWLIQSLAIDWLNTFCQQNSSSYSGIIAGIMLFFASIRNAYPKE